MPRKRRIEVNVVVAELQPLVVGKIMVDAPFIGIKVRPHRLLPRKSRRVQAIARKEVVGERHVLDVLRDHAAGVEAWPIRVLPEDADARQRACRSRRRDRIAAHIDGGACPRGVRVLGTREVAKNSLPRLGREHCGHNVILRNLALPLIIRVEECLVLFDRSPDAAAVLVTDQNLARLNLGTRNRIAAGGVTKPVVRVQIRVAMLFEYAAVKRIRTRACDQLQLADAATVFHVRG